jgi:hypothetical protein
MAGTAYRPAIAALTSLVPTTQILFGSDNPFVPLAETAEGILQIGFSADDLQHIGLNNALSLMPTLKANQAIVDPTSVGSLDVALSSSGRLVGNWEVNIWLPVTGPQGWSPA